ncbi:helix-turn-helix domain-containing protein [Bradyrhizobium sp. 41S5]|uniref:helix-turn-helix domain-containing protein n=1 Tax=Bradyrhizobium sp. 41S5 TaxID=1404443 RepID=UPI001595BC34|nr:helix-turn-helix domain-containing protein [Bradyrhizobium sp. 41S5]UFX46133.1 helix-turn-helix domain-containing protein [Bradyrhizobium sp. 41S5]
MTLHEKTEKENSKSKFYISPTERLDLLSALTKAQAKEEAKGKKQRKLLQVDLFVMMALIGHRNNKTGQCDPSHAQIAREIGVAESTVKRSFKRLTNAGFITTAAKYFRGLKTSSQVDIQFQKGEPWITKPFSDGSMTTNRSVTDDPTIGHGCSSRSVTDDLNDRSPMTHKHSELNPGNEHSEENTQNAPRWDGPAGVLDVEIKQGSVAQDNEPADWPTDWRDKFWNALPERKNVAATEKELGVIAKAGVKFESVLTAARRKCRTETVGYYRDPVKWLADEPWKDNGKPALRPRSKKGVAI